MWKKCKVATWKNKNSPPLEKKKKKKQTSKTAKNKVFLIFRKAWFEMVFMYITSVCLFSFFSNSHQKINFDSGLFVKIYISAFPVPCVLCLAENFITAIEIQRNFQSFLGRKNAS